MGTEALTDSHGMSKLRKRPAISTVKKFFQEQLESLSEADFPLLFVEAIGEHALTENVRQAITLASIDQFIDKEDLEEESPFTVEEEALASAIVFHGPFTDIVEALEESKRCVGVIVAPCHMWEKIEFVYVAILSH